MEFSRQEYWSGLSCPPPGDLPDPGVKLMSLMLSCIGRKFTTSANREDICYIIIIQNPASLVAQIVKNPPAMQENWVRSLGWEDPLDKEMATYWSILAWRIPWTEESGGLQFLESKRAGHNWVTNTLVLAVWHWQADILFRTESFTLIQKIWTFSRGYWLL